MTLTAMIGLISSAMLSSMCLLLEGGTPLTTRLYDIFHLFGDVAGCSSLILNRKNDLIVFTKRLNVYFYLDFLSLLVSSSLSISELSSSDEAACG